MQQLKGTWTVDEQLQQLMFTPGSTWNWDSLEKWLHQLAQNKLIDTVELSTGADRLQLYFHFEGQDYILHAEPLCEAVWIETTRENGQAKWQALLAVLS